MSKLQLVKQMFETLAKGNTFDKVLQKLTVVEATAGRCVCQLKLSDEHLNRGGSLHGGLTATLVDTVSTVALASNDNTPPGVSVNINVSYLRPAPAGSEIIIDASTTKLGKRLAFLNVEIKSKADGKLIATGTHTKFIS